MRIYTRPRTAVDLFRFFSATSSFSSVLVRPWRRRREGLWGVIGREALFSWSDAVKVEEAGSKVCSAIPGWSTAARSRGKVKSTTTHRLRCSCHKQLPGVIVDWRIQHHWKRDSSRFDDPSFHYAGFLRRSCPFSILSVCKLVVLIPWLVLSPSASNIDTFLWLPHLQESRSV